MAAIQIISAWLGWRTGNGLARNIADRLSPIVLYFFVALLAVANTINIAADLAAMGDVLRLVIGGPALAYAIAFGLACLAAEILVPNRYAGYLKFLTFVLLVYVAVAFTVAVPWLTVLRTTLLPSFAIGRDQILMVVAVFGTTISPYLFFWQASQEAEEVALRGKGKVRPARKMENVRFQQVSVDTIVGMVVSNIIAFFIIVTTAATLHANGVTHIETAAQAAEALRPIVGNLTFILFALGIIGTGMLAVPVLAGSAAYAVAEAFGLRESLELPADRAIGFYAIVGAATLGGCALAATNINPIAMLFWTAVINGVIAVPIMLAMMVVVSSAELSKTLNLPLWVGLLGWLGTALMAISARAWNGAVAGVPALSQPARRWVAPINHIRLSPRS